MSKPIVNICFREVKHGQFKGTIDAVFLDEFHDHYSDRIVCYAHVGQHSCGDYTYFRDSTKPAAFRDYYCLLNEIRSIYEDCELVIHDRLTRRFLKRG